MTYTFYKNNFIRTRGSFLLKSQKQIKNNPNLGRRTKSQFFDLSSEQNSRKCSTIRKVLALWLFR